MIKGDCVHAQTELEIDDVQFPIRYTFPQDIFTGVIDRSYSGTSLYGDQLRPVYDKKKFPRESNHRQSFDASYKPHFPSQSLCHREHNVLWTINNGDLSWLDVGAVQCQEFCNVNSWCAFFIYDNNRESCILQVEDDRAAPGRCEDHFDTIVSCVHTDSVKLARHIMYI